MKKRRKKRLKAAAISVSLSAYLVCSYFVFQPWISRASSASAASTSVTTFLERHQEAQNEASAGEDPEIQITPYAALLDAMRQYNTQIYAEKQSGLCDPFSVSTEALDLSAYGVENGIIGVLSIPSMDTELPIYSGASYENLDKGAAVLTQTSFPIGGESTNCVIAAHRGWRGEDYLRDIELVKIGDTITVTNFWETLEYRVTDIRIIAPNDIAQVLIQPGRDMLSIFTCHPYAASNPDRYLVVCDRTASSAAQEQPEQSVVNAKSATVPLPAASSVTVYVDGADFISSETQIRIIAIVPWLGIGISVLLFLSILILMLRYRQQ